MGNSRGMPRALPASSRTRVAQAATPGSAVFQETRSLEPPLRRPPAAGGPGDCRTSAGPGAPPGRAGGNAPRRPPPPRLPPAAAALPRRGAALKGGSPPPGALAARAPREPAAAMPPRAPPAPGPRPPPRAADVARGAGAAGRHGLPPLALRPWRWLLLLALPAACSALPPPRPVYTNHWAVQVLGGPGAADRVAAAHGYLNLGQVSTAGPARPKLSRPPAATREGAPCQARGQRRRVGRRPVSLGTAGASCGDSLGEPWDTRREGRGRLRGRSRGRARGRGSPGDVAEHSHSEVCGLGSPGRAPTPAQPRSSGRLRGRCALPTRAIIIVYLFPCGLRALAPSRATLPSTGRPELWAPVRAPRQSGAGWAM